MKIKIILLSFIIASLFSFNKKEIVQLKPKSEYFPDLSIQAQVGLKRFHELLLKENLLGSEKAELRKLSEIYSETNESIWDVIDGGCSWYCGGGNYKIEASSELKSNKNRTYTAIKANDLSYETAWVEGTVGSGIGEYLDYHFKPLSPEVTKIIVSNGYMKTENTWIKNNRVKSLKVSVNNKPYAILNLNDSRSSQEFEVSLNWKTISELDIVLRFEILEVFKGEKYDDTAITEIHFDGIGVH